MPIRYNYFTTGRSAAWLARLPWEQEVDGSNPFAPIFPNPFISRGLDISSSVHQLRLLRTSRVQLRSDDLHGVAKIGRNHFRINPLIYLFTVPHQGAPNFRANALPIGPRCPGATKR